MELKFSNASLSQHEAIDHLMLDCFTPYVQKLGGGPTSGPYPWLEAAIRHGDVYVALDGTKIVGVVTTSRSGDEFIIGQLGVDPSQQGLGIGSWILDQIDQIARHSQMKKITLQTAEMMHALLRLYDRHGFQVTHKALPEHGDDTHLRVHMTKLL